LAEEVKIEYDDFGFVKDRLCPQCGSSQLRFSHVDDVGTQWFKCQKCGRYCTLTKTEERKRLEEALAKPKEPQPILLSHLNMIEDPSLAGKPVAVEALVSSTSVAYLCPREVEALGSDDEGFDITAHKQISPEDPLNLQLISVNEAVKYRRLKRFLGLSRDANIQEKGYRTVYRIRVRPPVFTLEKRGEKIVDERGFEYKALDIYVVAEKPIVFQPSSLIRVEGLPLPNPKTQQTTLLAYKVDFPEENTTFDKGKLNTLKEKFEGLSVSERVCWILDNFERFSKIVGRRNLAMAGFLAYFTPLWVRFDGMLQRGWGNILFCGDTTTAKTETIRRLIMLLKAGMLITAETATAVGLTGTATQVEKEGWFVDWGFLVLLDRKLLAVDGAHKLSLSNWAALAEAERSGVVSIAKAAKNTAYARTRQIKIANPVDREADKYSTKSLSAFLYPCQAIPTILDKTSIARLDLAVFADQHDVAPEEINKVQGEEAKPELYFLSEALKWCWSGQAQIEFTMEAAKTIHDEAIGLYKTFFYDEIPLCSIDMKWKLARLSAALAFLTLSTEDYNKVTVTKEHVNLVAKFIREEYSKAGLNILAQTERHEALTLEDVETLLLKIERQLANVVDVETICDVLRFFVIRGRVTRDEVMAKFGLAETKQLRPLLATLTSEGLIKAKRGFYPEPKLIQAYKASEGFNFTKLTKVTKAGKEPPKILGEDKHESEKNDPSFSDLGKLGNLGKMEHLSPMDNG
jgi:ribosomal protein S27AE